MTRLLSVLSVLSALALACNGARPPPPPKKPEPVDPVKLAAQLHGDLVKLGEIARRLKADCPALVTELRAHVQVMRVHRADVDRASADAELVVKLKAEVDVYAESTRGLGTAIGEDLGEAWQSCKVRAELNAVIDQIPEM